MKLKETLNAVLERVEAWEALIALVIGLFVGVASSIAWIRSSARNAVLDEKFLETLAVRIRPTCIFNSQGTVEDNFGTEDYIEGFLVTPTPTNSGFEVQIKGKRHLTHAPLVTGINVGLFAESVTRTPGTMNDWTVRLSPQTTAELIGAEGGPSYTNGLYHFKLEIMH